MNNLPRIKALPKDIADKIAAGEIVERPLSIVKELLENSIDSGATSIVVELRNGGKSYIRITDNGCGILKDDIPLAFARYATSKIAKEQDLHAIQTLGFRGEALSSIAAVSIVELITKTQNAHAGTKAILEAGIIKDMSEIACEEGTTIIIKDLFYNIPARKKFLKPDHTESALVIDYISKMTLAYPDIKIKLLNNEIILFATQGNGNVHRNILTVYSRQTDENLIEISDKDANQGLSLTGYIGKPDKSKKNRKFQIFFVNGRWINSKLIEAAVNDAYADKVFPGNFPIIFLFLHIDPSKIDVNIHPNKMNVRFFEEEAVKEFLYKGIRNALLREIAAPNVYESESVNTRQISEFNNNASEHQVDIKTISLNDTRERYERIFSLHSDNDVQDESMVAEPVNAYTSANRFLFSELNIIGNLFAMYVLASNEDSMYIIDQHAAHERILFEQLIYNYQKEKAAGQILMLPFLVEIPHYIKENGKDIISLLERLGYRIEEFGPKEYIVKEIPSCMDLSQAEIFINEFFEAPIEEIKALPEARVGLLISTACKAAIKANDRLSEREMRELLFRLDQTENPFSCPHGRPTFIKLSGIDLERLFKRK